MENSWPAATASAISHEGKHVEQGVVEHRQFAGAPAKVRDRMEREAYAFQYGVSKVMGFDKASLQVIERQMNNPPPNPIREK